MISNAPELETRVESSLTQTLKDAFPGVTVGAWSEPKDRTGKSIGVKVDNGGEEPQGTNIFNVTINIEARNLENQERELMRRMIGSSSPAKDTITAHGLGKFVMPSGQPVEVAAIARTAEDENQRVMSYVLTTSIQPI